MGSNWAWNLFTSKSLSDTAMEDIPFPRSELHIHVMYKTVQMGTVMGVVIGTLVGAIRRRPITASLLRGGQIGAVIGIPAGPAMTEMTLKKTNSTGNIKI